MLPVEKISITMRKADANNLMKLAILLLHRVWCVYVCDQCSNMYVSKEKPRFEAHIYKVQYGNEMF